MVLLCQSVLEDVGVVDIRYKEASVTFIQNGKHGREDFCLDDKLGT